MTVCILMYAINNSNSQDSSTKTRQTSNTHCRWIYPPPVTSPPPSCGGATPRQGAAGRPLNSFAALPSRRHRHRREKPWWLGGGSSLPRPGFSQQRCRLPRLLLPTMLPMEAARPRGMATAAGGGGGGGVGGPNLGQMGLDGPSPDLHPRHLPSSDDIFGSS
jgi:hypothetical protein